LQFDALASQAKHPPNAPMTFGKMCERKQWQKEAKATKPHPHVAAPPMTVGNMRELRVL
jgi:hypothetical protein